MLNNVLDKFRSTINNASDNLSATVQNIAETNRNKKKLSLLKMMMKSEIKQMDLAYIELGKEYYKLLKKSGRKPADKKQQDLLKNLDDSMAKITYARDCYRAIMESESKASGEDTAEQSAPIEEAEKAVPVAEEKPVSVAPVVEEKPVTTAPVVEEKPVTTAPVVEEKPVSVAPVVEQKPVAPAVVEEKPIAPAVVEEKPITPAVVEEKPVTTAPVVEEKPVSAAPVVEEKPVSVAPVVEQKPVAPAVVEEKPISVPPVVEEKPVSVAPVVEEKPVSAPESKVDELRGIAAVGVAGIAKETVQSAAVVTEKKMPIADEKKAVSTADTADGKVKKVSKDLETLKRDNRRLREALMKIAKTMMAVGSADNDKENPDDAS